MQKKISIEGKVFVEDKGADDVVACLRMLSKALAIYDRALFHYDTTRPTSGVVPPPEKIDISLNYDFYFKKLPEGNAQGKIGKRYIAALEIYKVWLAIQIIDIYFQAGQILSARYEYVAWMHKQELDKIGKGKPIADRNPEYASSIAQIQANKFIALLDSLSTKLKRNTVKNYCAYEVEFDTLSDSCVLLIDEIEFLSKRVDELQNFIRHKRNEIIAFSSMLAAIFTILIGTIWDRKSYHVSVSSLELAKQNATTPVKIAEPSNNSALAIEIGKISAQMAQLVGSLNQAPQADKPKSEEIVSAITKLATAINSGNQTTATQVTTALEALEKSLNDFPSKLTTSPITPNTEDAAKAYQAALAQDIKSIKDSIVTLKSSVEAMKPTEIIIKGDDNSNRKSGVFNFR